MSVREKIVLGGLLVAGLGGVAFGLLGDQGLREVRRLQAERQHLTSEIVRLRARKSTLEKEIAALREDPKAIGRRARQDLGMIRQGETVFLLPEHHDRER